MPAQTSTYIGAVHSINKILSGKGMHGRRVEPCYRCSRPEFCIAECITVERKTIFLGKYELSGRSGRKSSTDFKFDVHLAVTGDVYDFVFLAVLFPTRGLG